MIKTEMSMKKIFGILAAAAAVTLTASCDLNLTPANTLSYDRDNLVTNETDLNGFEAGVLAQIRGLEYGVYDWASDVQMDYFNAVNDYGNNGGSVHRSDDSFTASDYDSRDNWSGPYGAIKNFNIVINGMQVVPDGLQKKAALARGEAYFGRAMAYLHMVRLFGKPYNTGSNTLGMPLVTEYDQSARPARSTVAETYELIKKDLDSASVLLAGVPGAVASQKPTIDAVNALYARYYLDLGDWSNAASKAMSVINSKAGYKLSSTAEEMEAEWINDEGTEPIMQMYASLTEGIGSHSYYQNMAMDSQEGHGLYYHPYFIPTKALVEAYDQGDLRKDQWFTTGEPFYASGLWYDNITVFTKYHGNPALRSNNIPNSGQAIKPFLISEMYLIAAEAYLNSGNTGEATAQLNVLQGARGAAKTVANEETVRNEWFKETVGEGLRISCLKRWGAGYSTRAAQENAGGVVVEGANYTEKSMPASDFHFQWPVPTYEMQINTNLVQNDGYKAEAID